MFKAIVLCALYNLSDDQVGYQLRDRLTFMRFLGLGLEDRVPDAELVRRYQVIEATLDEKGMKNWIHRKWHRNKPLSEREARGNKTRVVVRARVEHVFGDQSNDMGGTLVRGIGLVRAKGRIGLKNLAYNMRRLVQLERLAAAMPT